MPLFGKSLRFRIQYTTRSSAFPFSFASSLTTASYIRGNKKNQKKTVPFSLYEAARHLKLVRPLIQPSSVFDFNLSPFIARPPSSFPLPYEVIPLSSETQKPPPCFDVPASLTPSKTCRSPYSSPLGTAKHGIVTSSLGRRQWRATYPAFVTFVASTSPVRYSHHRALG